MAADGNINRHTFNGNIYFTPDGGMAVSLINKTGTTSVKGTVVEADSGTNFAFNLSDVGSADPIGIVYGDADGNQVADGEYCWVVVSGCAYVWMESATDRHEFVRMGEGGDGNDAAGFAIGEALPTSPFATDKHFQEVGHSLETTGGAGLCLCVLHFN